MTRPRAAGATRLDRRADTLPGAPSTGPGALDNHGSRGYDIVVPTIGRDSLRRLLGALSSQPSCRRRSIIVVDDRPRPEPALDLPDSVKCCWSYGQGPAAARNVGWRTGDSPWVVFLDDDVVPTSEWTASLEHDLEDCTAAGTQGQIVVPVEPRSRLSDWERNVKGLERARFATADMAYRRAWLERVGGFDERFPRAFREDADLALRILDAGGSLANGTRVVHHPVRPARPLVSLRAQRQNADDARMRARHGRNWRRRSGAEGPARLVLHMLTTVSAATTGVCLARRHRKCGRVAALTWTVLFFEFAFRRIHLGPRDRNEVFVMLATSVAIPPAAVASRVGGELAVRLERRSR